jgi:hypothetical protein
MHSSSLPRRFALLAAAVALTIPLIGPRAALADDDDMANVGVARVSLISGSVAVQRGDATSPSAAVVNAPVLAGDYLTTGDDSRAEVEIDGGTVVRLGDGVQMRFTHLENDARAIQLAAGTIELRLLRGTDGSSNIDTPSISVRPRAGGSYRVSVTPDGQTLVTVRSGDAEIIGPQGAQSLTPGTTLVAQGPASAPSIVSQAEIAADGFDQFNAERDASFQQALGSDRYVDPDITGVADLAANGNWVSDPSYGEVWTPTNVPPDWAPYRDGSWVWEANFGWTWVGTEAWGWAPYHYGAWYHSAAYGWAWYPPRPGPVVPVWRPAMVGFVTFGGGGAAAIGYAGGGLGVNIGWVPLAPYEPYHPWWGNRWGGGVNAYISNEAFVHTYRNAQYGVTAVPGRRFTSGSFGHPMVVAAAEMRDVQAIRGALPVVPSRANLRFSNAQVAPGLAVRESFAAHAFAGAGAPVQRVPFEQQRAAYASATHLPLSPAREDSAYGSAGAYHADGAPARSSGDAWTRFGENRSLEGGTHGTNSVPSYAGAGRGAEGAPSYARPSGSVPSYARGTGNVPSYARGTGNVPSYSRGTGNVPASSREGAAGFPNGGYGYRTSGTGTARSYNAPSRAYSAAPRSYSAPARSSSVRTYRSEARSTGTSHAVRSSSHGDRRPG